MGAATYLQHSFLGGEISKSVQGRIDNPQYRTWLNAMLNWIPIEGGSMTRRPGFRFCGTTRGGAPGRVIRFDFNQSTPYTMEFTDGILRFWNTTNLVMSNDPQAVTGISTANPASVTTATPHGWSTGNRISFSNLGANDPLLQNRVFTITVTGPTTFTITDSLTNTTIDGSTLGPFASATASRSLELVTAYSSGAWRDLRAVLTDVPIPNGITAGAVFLHGQVPPYLLTVTSLPTSASFATFSLALLNFLDGPYFDPPPNGATLTPSGLSGVITLTITFPAFDATIAYSRGDFVASGGINYQSLIDQNQGNTPATSPTAWAVVSSGLAIGPNGFQGTDVNRLVRLYSEPPLWASTTAYTTGQYVSYPSGVNGAFTYWRALAGNTNVVPGTSVTTWAVDPAGALWSWGKITGLSNLINPLLGGSVNIGNLTTGGGLAAAFDNNTNKSMANCANLDLGGPGNSYFVGKNYSGATAQRVASATIFPSSDKGFVSASFFNAGAGFFQDASAATHLTINLRAKATAPANSADGTLLGSTGVLTGQNAPISIISNNTTTTWNFVWFEVISDYSFLIFGGNFPFTNLVGVAQAQFFSPVSTGGGNAVQFQILGNKLLYTTPVRVWRLGLYSNTTGFPAVGVYHEGRIWLTGAVDNRIDSSKSNGILTNGSVDFAPTNVDGSVSDDNGISYIFNAPDVNPIFWMSPDQLGIVCGTQAGEWLVQASNNNNPLSPTNIQAHRMTTNRCANIEPRRAPLTLVVVHNMRRMVLEYFADVFSGKFAAKQLTLNTQHLTHPLVQELAFQRELAPVIWARCGDGSLIGCTYKRESLVSSQEPDYAGWHRHVLGSGRTVESICTGGNIDATADTLYIVSNDAVTGTRHVEMLNDLFEEGDNVATAWHQDDAVLPRSTVSNSAPVVGAPYGGLTINGLWHLNGLTVSVSAGGLDCGDFAVVNGSTFVSYGDGITGGTASGQFTAAYVATNPQIIVGFTYNSDAQIVRVLLPAESGARSGPALGKKRRHHRYSFMGLNMTGLSIGTVFTKLFPVLFKSDANVIMPIGQTFSGVYHDTINDDYSYDSMPCWRVSRPYTSIVSAFEGFVHTQDE